MDSSEEAVKSESTFERVVDLLNDAALETDVSKKVTQLHQVQEFIVHKEPNLLDNFLDEMLAFQSDQEAEVRRLIAGFIEDAVQSDAESIPKTLTNLMMLLSDQAVSVIKRAITTAGVVYTQTFAWLTRSKHQISDIQLECWDFVNKMKKNICDRQSSDNEGIKAHVIRYMEALILCCSYAPLRVEASENDTTKTEEQTAEVTEVSLLILPDQHSLLDAANLIEEGRRLFQILVQLTSSESVTSQTLMAMMSSVASIASQRPAFVLPAVELFEALQTDLPPNLAKSQVFSVRKSLKMQIIRMAKKCNDLSAELAHRIGTLLSDLGATQAEVLKIMPKQSNTSSQGSKRKLGPSASEGPESKLSRQPLTIPLVPTTPTTVAPSTPIRHADRMAEEFIPRLTLNNVTELVLAQMHLLPDVMPVSFQSLYSPISDAGSSSQVRSMSKMLSNQICQSKEGQAYIARLEPMSTVTANQPDRVVKLEERHEVVELPKLGVRQPQKVARHYKLADVTPTSMSREQIRDSALSCIKRTLNAEQNMSKTKLHAAWVKIVSSMAAMLGEDYKHALFNFICEDIRGRFELAVTWLTHEYAVDRGFLTSLGENGTTSSYDTWLTRMLQAVYEKTNAKLGLFGQLLLQTQTLTPGALEVLRIYCQDENCSYLGMSVLCELATNRLAERSRLLPLLLDFSLHERPEVRSNALRELRKMYTRFDDDTGAAIERFAVESLRWLSLPMPPDQLTLAQRQRGEAVEGWNEELLKTASALFLTLVPAQPQLLDILAEVFVSAQADLKKPLLKILDQPIKQMGMQSGALLEFISSCPKGAETLVARLVHILTTENQPAPAAELVSRVYALYQNRVDDVRFLIPVIPGLTKKQIFSILPDVVKLNPGVVREVLGRIIGKSGQIAACSPAELLVELHTLDTTKCDLKQVIKTVNLLLSDKQSFTQEVMAVVLQQLIDVSPLPVLLMRTLLQSLAMYPRLIGLSMNIMHRLIQKQVWKYPRLWDGFVRCCQQTKPRSFEVLLQLPVAQLNSVFEAAPDLRKPLIDHVMALPETQISAISRATMAVLQNAATSEESEEPAKMETTEST